MLFTDAIEINYDFVYLEEITNKDGNGGYAKMLILAPEQINLFLLLDYHVGQISIKTQKCCCKITTTERKVYIFQLLHTFYYYANAPATEKLSLKIFTIINLDSGTNMRKYYFLFFLSCLQVLYSRFTTHNDAF